MTRTFERKQRKGPQSEALRMLSANARGMRGRVQLQDTKANGQKAYNYLAKS